MALMGFRRLSGKKSGGGRGGSGGGSGGSGLPGFSESEAVKMIKASTLRQTDSGELANINDLDTYITNLKTLGDNPTVQIEIANAEASKLKFKANYDALVNDKDIFQTDLQTQLNKTAQANYNNPYAMIASYAQLYGDASESFDNEMMSKITTKYGTETPIPKDQVEYGEKLKAKAKLYSDLFNSYYFQDPQTGEIGAFDSNQYAMVPTVNPANGKIVSMEIEKTSDIDTSKVMKTDTPMRVFKDGGAKTIPVYLPTVQVGLDDKGKPIMGAKFGNITYAQPNSGTNVLSAKRSDDGFLGIGGLFKPDFTKNVDEQIDNARTNGLVMDSANGFNFDSGDAAGGSLLRYGSHVMYKTDKGDIVEIQGKDSDEKMNNLNNYLKANGKDPSSVGNPMFVDRSYLDSVKPENRIDANYLQPAAPTQSVQTPVTPGQAQGNAKALGQLVGAGANKLGQMASSFFAGRGGGGAAPNKPDVAPESSGGILNTPDIISKGMSFFGSQKTGLDNAFSQLK